MQIYFDHAARKRVSKRGGFTMVELLVVVAIVSLLIAIGGAVIANSISQARERATRALLLKLDGLLQQRLDGFSTLMAKPQKQQELKTIGVNTVISKLKNNNIVGVPSSMISLMAYKEFFRIAFPQTSADNPSLSTRQQYFNGNMANSAESSEYLYWIITKSDSFGVSAVDDSQFTSSELRDTDGDGRLEFVDSWGRPLRFYRWPTRIFRPSGPGSSILPTVAGLFISGLPDATELQQDPDDAVGVYDATIVSGVMTPQQYENLYQTPDTYSLPLIVSAGLDGTTPAGLGLYEPYDTTNFGNLAQPLPAALANPGASALNDNLTNRQKQK